MPADTVFPFLDDALAFLLDKAVLSGKKYAQLSRTDKLKIIGSSTIESARAAAQLRQLLADSLEAGDDERQFRKRIEDEIQLRRSDANRILRTNSKQAYIDGMASTLEKPHIAATFPFVLYVATHDGRTRPAHLAMDGKIAQVGSPEYDEMRAMLADWNCRCSLVALSVKQAIQRGYDVPASLRDALTPALAG